MERRDYLLMGALAAGALFLYIWGTWTYPLWDPWEPKYAQTVREMVERGDFLTPYLNDKIRWTKPILIYWAIYVPTLIFGDTEFSARLPSVIAGVLGVLLTFYPLRRLRGRGTALVAASILATLPQYYFMARQSMPDMLLVMFLIAAMGFFALGRFIDERRRLHYGLFYLSVSLAFLTKGPVACAIVVGAIGIFWLIDFDPARLRSPRDLLADLRRSFSDYHVGLGLLIFLGVAAPWYVVTWFRHGDLFIESFVIGENLKRFRAPIFSHHGDVTYYLRTMFHGMFPWFSVVPFSILFCFRWRRELDEESRQRWYYLSWFLAIFALFTIAGTKLDHYILPIAPPTAVLAALFWEQYLDRDPPYWVRPALLLSLILAFLPIRDFLVEDPSYIMSVFVPQQVQVAQADSVDLALRVGFAAWVVVVLGCYLVPRSRAMLLAAVLVAYAGGIYFSHHVIPASTHERTLKYYVDGFDEMREPDAELVFYGKIRYSLRYYLGKGHYEEFEPEELHRLTAFVQGKPHVYIIGQDLWFDDLLERLHISTRSRWSTIRDDHPAFTLISNSPQATGGESAPTVDGGDED